MRSSLHWMSAVDVAIGIELAHSQIRQAKATRRLNMHPPDYGFRTRSIGLLV
jgi:hypothetical protein